MHYNRQIFNDSKLQSLNISLCRFFWANLGLSPGAPNSNHVENNSENQGACLINVCQIECSILSATNNVSNNPLFFSTLSSPGFLICLDLSSPLRLKGLKPKWKQRNETNVPNVTNVSDFGPITYTQNMHRCNVFFWHGYDTGSYIAQAHIRRSPHAATGCQAPWRIRRVRLGRHRLQNAATSCQAP